MRLLTIISVCAIMLAMLCVPSTSHARPKPLRKVARFLGKKAVTPFRLFARAGHGHERGGCGAHGCN